MSRSSKNLRILVLMHSQLVPPDKTQGLSKEEIAPFRTELDILEALKDAGHDVFALGVDYELKPLRDSLAGDARPDIVFNLLEEFRELRQFDQNMVAYLELMGCPYTGCNPRGLVLARDKALSKKILHYHRIPVPKFMAFARGKKARRPKRLDFPLIVKPLVEEGSTGISQASVVRSEEKFQERIRFIHEKIETDAIAEEFIDGREVYSAILGNQRTTVFPTWEFVFEKKPDSALHINTQKAKWDLEYQKKWGIKHAAAGLPEELEARVHKMTKRIYRRLGLSGYARIDYRITDDGRIYFLEANPNPDIAQREEFAQAALTAGLSYGKLLDRLIRLGLTWRPAQSVEAR